MSLLSVFASGRSASVARRQALSQGKTALPAPTERVRTGHRAAALPGSTASPAFAATPTPNLVAVAAEPAAPAASSGLAGRLMSMLRRRQQAAGKQPSIPPTHGRAQVSTAAGATAAAASAAAPAPNGREIARARRAALSQNGRGETAASPARPARRGRIDYAPEVAAGTTQARQPVTGIRIGRGTQVTGDEAGSTQPVSGTQYLDADAGGARPAAPKVGQMRTAGGLVVSGTLVRNRTRITGDEFSDRIRITGEADPSEADDIGRRDADSAPVPAQFARQANPHGHSVFGTNLGRSAGVIGSRARERVRPLEATDGGAHITGSAVGRSGRVTGDEAGACRSVTGDQYLMPAATQAECGVRGDGGAGGTAPATLLGAARRDPVTGAKVTEAQTWSGARITGPDLEHRPGVTGDEPGSCSVVTGTPYQGPATAYGWCEPQAAARGEARQVRRPASTAITGDVPLNDPAAVTGTERGATRDVTGTPYYREAPADGAANLDPVARIAQSFSVSSPQRQAHLRADRDALRAPTAAGRITGAFSIGGERVTGNVEFAFRPRAADGQAQRPIVTGEGGTKAMAVTGDAWRPHPGVTGTEGYVASERNPSERAGKAQAFAGTRLFKSKGHHEEPRQIVTGMVGWTAKSAAKVTLSGGAQG